MPTILPQNKIAKKLNRDLERMKLISILPDIYIKTRSKSELVSLLSPLDRSTTTKAQKDLVSLALMYKRDIRESYRDVKVSEQLELYRKQVTQLIKAVINPSAIAGYNPELDRISIISRMQNEDFLEFLKQIDSPPDAEDEDTEESLGEAYRQLYQDDEEEKARFDQDVSEDLGLSDKLNWDNWRDVSPEESDWWFVNTKTSDFQKYT